MSRQIALQIVEPSDIIVEGLKAILEEEDFFNLLAPMRDGGQLESRLPVLRPDMLLANPTLFGAQARQAVATLQQARPGMPVVALVYEYVPAETLAAFDGVLDIRMPRNKVGQMLRDLASDQDSLPNDQMESYELSDRETDVLVLVAKGLSSKMIADTLNISIHTVNSHRKNITKKTGIKSVAGLAVYAMLHNLA